MICAHVRRQTYSNCQINTSKKQTKNGRQLTKSGDEIFRIGKELFMRRQVWWRHCRAVSGRVVVVRYRPVVAAARWRDRVPGGETVRGCRGVGLGIGRHGRRRRLGDDGLGVGQLVLLLPLHAAVLEPDLDLALGEAERVRDLDAPAPRQVAIKVKLFLELENLMLRVGGSRALAVHAGETVAPISTCMHTSTPSVSLPTISWIQVLFLNNYT